MSRALGVRAGRLRAVLVVFLATVTMLIASPRATDAHPIHTTLATITWDTASRAVVVSLRVFADDFGVAVARHSGVSAGPDHSVAETAAYAYLRSMFTLSDASGRALPLEWCGVKRTGEVVWVCLRTPFTSPPRGLRVLNSVLFDVHADQVNLVQATLAGKKSSVLFTRGDRARAIQ